VIKVVWIVVVAFVALFVIAIVSSIMNDNQAARDARDRPVEHSAWWTPGHERGGQSHDDQDAPGEGHDL
jgi:hypothetical protein